MNNCQAVLGEGDEELRDFNVCERKHILFYENILVFYAWFRYVELAFAIVVLVIVNTAGAKTMLLTGADLLPWPRPTTAAES